jgi:hypothetical protein
MVSAQDLKDLRSRSHEGESIQMNRRHAAGANRYMHLPRQRQAFDQSNQAMTQAPGSLVGAGGPLTPDSSVFGSWIAFRQTPKTSRSD